MSFANPWVLFLLLLLPLIVLLSFWRANQSNMQISLVAHDKSFANFFDTIGYYLPFILRILCLAALIIALARPQFGQSFTTSTNYGVDLMIAVDTSESMSAIDMTLEGEKVDRLTIVKKILKDFVTKRDKDRLGLLVFGEKAYTQCPLTTDHGAVLDLLDYVRIGMVGNATAIGSAIAIAVKRLKDLKAESRVLILMTDGHNTAGSISPKTAMKIAKEYKIKIYTIGIGKSGAVPFVINSPMGKVVKNQLVPMDEDTLIQIAEETGGRYYRAESTEELKRIYNDIDKLEKTKIEVKKYNTYKDIFEPLLWFAFLFFILEVALGNTLLFRIN